MRWSWPSTARRSWSTTSAGASGARATGSAAEDTVKLITDHGGVAVPNFADVSDFDKSGEMVQQAIDEFGKLDILVNNAGIVRDAAIWNMKVEDWDAVMRVHVRGTWCPTHHASKHWRERAKEGPLKARIVNTTSGAGLGATSARRTTRPPRRPSSA